MLKKKAVTSKNSYATKVSEEAFEYDALKRQSSRYNEYYKSSYSYALGKNSGETTTQVSGIDYTARPGGTSFSAFGVDYTYDALGNITSITSTEWPDLNATYKYDAQGQLIEETNRNNTFYYTYDTYGNIRTAQKADSTSSTVFSEIFISKSLILCSSLIELGGIFSAFSLLK